MPDIPTFTSPILERNIFPHPFTSPVTRPRPAQDLASAQLHAAQVEREPDPVILLPETGANLGGCVFTVVFIAFCAFAWWVGRGVKR